jgi:hypothetical protein
MTEDPRPHQCDAFSDNLAELALGILTGRERAATLAHVDSCAHCAEELEQLARTADAVVTVAPEMEPTVGFEVRLFNRMGVAEAAPRRRAAPLRWVGKSPRWAMMAAAAAIALVVGLSIGWTTGSPSGGRSAVEVPHPAGPQVATADLTKNGHVVGRAAIYGGSNPWMIVTLADSWSDGTVTCEVVTANGVTHRVGSFTAKDGYGSWGAPLRVAPQDVRKAEVVTSNGTVIATAVLS